MKKLISLLLTASLLTVSGLSGILSASADTMLISSKPSFTDISDEKYAWAKQYIEQMAQQGYINGYEDSTYRPDNAVTRLETIVLFARAMGANKEENADILEYAMEQYGDIVRETGINYGFEEVSYMLYRGALTELDLKLYLTYGKASEPMQRQEASAIITKAMCASKTAESEVLVDMEYTDAKFINSKYSQFVFYVSEMGIMNGMDDGSFQPEGSVLRSQIAAMLYRTVDKMNLYIEEATVINMDTVKNNITIADSFGEEIPMGYVEYTKFYLDGKLSDENSVEAHTPAILTYINNELVFVDMLEKVIDDTVKGIYQGYTNQNGEMTVTVKDANDDANEYKLSSFAKCFDEKDNELALNSFKAGDYVEVEIVDGVVISVRKIKTQSVIQYAVVEDISIEDEVYLTISHDEEEYDGMRFVIGNDVIVYKNNDREDLSKIYKGDRIVITMEYGIVTKLVATSDNKTYEGTITEVIISSNPALKVKINGEVREFDIVSKTSIVTNGAAASLYDLRVGDTVKITTESGALLSVVTVTPASTAGSVTGVIETVNTSMGFIRIDGETIFCKDTTTTVISSNGTNKLMKDLKEGMTVSVRGTLTNGAYTASLIIIEG